MAKRTPMEGLRFGAWTVLDLFGYTKKGQALYMCRCDCGNYAFVRGDNLRLGRTHKCLTCAAVERWANR